MLRHCVSRGPSRTRLKPQAFGSPRILPLAGEGVLQENSMGFWFGRKSAPAMRPFVPAWLRARAKRAGLRAAMMRSWRRSIAAIRSGSGRCGWLRGWLARLPVYAAEGDERAAAIVCGGRAAGAHCGGAAAARQCLCPADRRRTMERRRNLPACGRSGSAWRPTSGGGRRLISIAPAGRSTRIARSGCAGAAAGGAFEERSIRATTIMGWAAWRRRRGGERAQSRQPLEQGAARQCGAAERGAGL